MLLMRGRQLMALAILLVGLDAVAKPPPSPQHVCVREFFNDDGGVNPCRQQGGVFVKVVSADNPDDAGAYICTKAYAESYCDSAPNEFKHVETLDAQAICTTDFHQPGVGEYCYDAPKIFKWARLHSEGQ